MVRDLLPPPSSARISLLRGRRIVSELRRPYSGSNRREAIADARPSDRRGVGAGRSCVNVKSLCPTGFEVNDDKQYRREALGTIPSRPLDRPAASPTIDSPATLQ